MIRVDVLLSGTGTVPEFLRGYLEKGVFALGLSDNRTWVPRSGTKCEHSLSCNVQQKTVIIRNSM